MASIRLLAPISLVKSGLYFGLYNRDCILRSHINLNSTWNLHRPIQYHVSIFITKTRGHYFNLLSSKLLVKNSWLKIETYSLRFFLQNFLKHFKAWDQWPSLIVSVKEIQLLQPSMMVLSSWVHVKHLFPYNYDWSFPNHLETADGDRGLCALIWSTRNWLSPTLYIWCLAR